MKFNCWEFKKCGRHPGGDKIKELGICQASLESKLNGVHGGRNGGRACWVVARTLCKGEIQGEFAHKYEQCKECDFYKSVKKEEGLNYQMLHTLLDKLNSK